MGVTWWFLHLAVESPWSASGGPFCSFFTQTGLEDSHLAFICDTFGNEASFQSKQ